jgi:hypothetical protein
MKKWETKSIRRIVKKNKKLDKIKENRRKERNKLKKRKGKERVAELISVTYK